MILTAMHSIIWAIIWIALGWFILYKVPSLVSARGTLATVIKIIGVVIMIAGALDLIGAIV